MNPIVLNHKGKFITLAIIVMILILLPIVARYTIVYVIEEQGFEHVSIEDVDINLFSGKVSIDKVHLKNASVDKLSVGELNVDYRWQGIFSGGIATELIELKDTRLKIIANENGDLEIVVPITPAPESDQNTVEPETKNVALPKLDVDLLRFTNIIVDIDLPTYKSQLVIDTFVLTRASTWHDHPAELLLKASLDEALINININAEPNADKPILSGDISIENILISRFNKFLPADLQQIKGKTNANFTFNGSRDNASDFHFLLNGAVDVADFDLAYKHVDVSLASANVGINTNVVYENEELRFESELIPALLNFLITDTEQEYTVFSFDKINIDKVIVDQDINLGFKQFDLVNVKVMPGDEEQQLMYFKNLGVSNLTFSLTDNALEIDKVDLAGLQYKLHLDQEYKLLDIDKLTKTIETLSGSSANAETVETDDVIAQTDDVIESNEEMTPEPENSEINSSLSVAIGLFEVSDENLIHMIKEFPDQTIERQFFIDTLNVKEINLNPSEPRSEFNLIARVDEFAKINVSGDALFFDQPLDLNAKGELDGMSLARLSPFSESVIGYQLISGQLDHKFTLALKDNQLDMQNNLLIRKIQLKENEKGDNKTEAGSLPLPMAISMLEDSDGHIDLELPIKSDLNNTDVGLASIINTSLSTVIQKGSMSFLKYSLQPFGAILFAGEILLEQSNNINFEPMMFNTNSSDLAEGQLEYVDKLTELLLNKEQISINLCGISNEQDKIELEAFLSNQNLTEQASTDDSTNSANESVVDTVAKKLIALADSRSKVLKGLFVGKGVAAKRLFVCKPEFDAEGINGVNIIM